MNGDVLDYEHRARGLQVDLPQGFVEDESQADQSQVTPQEKDYLVLQGSLTFAVAFEELPIRAEGRVLRFSMVLPPVLPGHSTVE